MGAATRKTRARVGLIQKDATMAVSIITGERNPGRMPEEMEFWMVVTSLVSRVTREDSLKRSVLAKENSWSFANSAFRISAPSPWPHRAAKAAAPWPRIRESSARMIIWKPRIRM